MKNVKVITATCYLSMLFLGVAISLVGAAARNIGLDAYQIGLLVAAQNVGFIASVFGTGTRRSPWPAAAPRRSPTSAPSAASPFTESARKP